MNSVFAKYVTPALMLGALALLPLAASAQAPPPDQPAGAHMGVPGRIQRQRGRIEQGVDTGALNRRQARRLRGRDERIQDRARADRRRDGGKLTYGQRRRLEGRLNRTSGAIYRRKH